MFMLIIEKLKAMQKFGTKFYDDDKMVTLENIQNQDKISVDKNYKDITTIHEKIISDFDINH